MVNITYGLLYAPDGTANTSRLMSPQGTDLIVTYGEGQIAAYSPGDIAWILTCTALVFLMIPGLGYLYSGLARRKNALHVLMITIVALAIVTLQWFLGGYSLVFAPESSNFWGTLKNFGYMKVLQEPVAASNNKLPNIVFSMYELMFACLVPAIALGAACERARLWPFFVFTFFWTTFVYDPIAMWVWNPNGWAAKWGILDYAGGGPVEISSGITGTVISIYLGHRYGYGTEKLLFKPHNVSHVVLGTVLLWVGWIGFNGGSTFAANLRAGMAIATTNLAGSVAGLTWMVMDYRLERKWSVEGFCTGAIAGLVAITPAAGFVGMPAALLIGVVSAFCCNLSTGLKNLVRVDDAMDVFAVHALAGVIGLLLTGIFAQKSVANNDGYLQIEGGWLDGHFVQLPLQMAWCAVTICWNVAVTFLLLFVIDHIPYIGPFRPSEIGELVGMDIDQCGEAAYVFEDNLDDLEVLGHHGRHLSQIESHNGSAAQENYNEKREGAAQSDDTSGTGVERKHQRHSIHTYTPPDLTQPAQLPSRNITIASANEATDPATEPATEPAAAPATDSAIVPAH